MGEFDPDRPFGGVLGSTAELRVLDLMLSMPRHSYNIAELSRASDLARGTCDRVVKHLVQWRLLDVASCRGNVTSYRINEVSSHIAALREFHFATIGDEPRVSPEPAASANALPRLLSSIAKAARSFSAAGWVVDSPSGLTASAQPIPPWAEVGGATTSRGNRPHTTRELIAVEAA